MHKLWIHQLILIDLSLSLLPNQRVLLTYIHSTLPPLQLYLIRVPEGVPCEQLRETLSWLHFTTCEVIAFVN